jgi:DNA-binding response OmpR family regulator
VRGLRAGGDDYLAKPFATVELVDERDRQYLTVG